MRNITLKFKAQGITKNQLADYGEYHPSFTKDPLKGAVWSFKVPMPASIPDPEEKARHREARRAINALFNGQMVD
jgi:hypothetical protein